MSLFAQLDSGRLCRGAGNDSRAGYASSVLGVFAAHKMPGAGPLSPYLTGSGDLDSFAQALVSLLLTHLVNSFKITQNRGFYAFSTECQAHSVENLRKRSESAQNYP